MRKRLPILLISAGMVFHAAAQAPPTGPQAGAGVPSLQQDTRKVLGAITSSFAAGWQRMTQAVDSFLREPPAPSAPAIPASPPPAAQTAPPAQPPAQPPAKLAPATQAVAIQVAPATMPAPPQPIPAPPPAPPAKKPATVTATPPPAPPQPKSLPPASTPAQPPKPPVLISSLAVQPAAPASPQPQAATATLSATQTLVHPTATATNPLKYLVAKYTSPSQPARNILQGSPISLDVRRIVKRKYLPDSVDFPYLGWSARSRYRESASLHITVENVSPQLFTNVVVQWAVVKKSVGRDSAAKPVVYGARETLMLKPIDGKSIETPSVEVEGRSDQNVGRSSGEIIRGHAVQVLIGTNVVAEELFPPTLKVSFKNLQPVPKPPPKE